MKKNCVQLSLARSRVYKHLSSAFLYPRDDFFNLLQNGTFTGEIRNAASLLTELKPFKLEKLKRSIDLMEKSIKKITLEVLQSEYRRIFGNIISKECPPYETQYGAAHIYQQTKELADIAGFYRAFGLDVSSTAGERLDYISIELEYMYFLTYKEAYASEKHGADKVEICTAAQKKFLGEHLGKWIFFFIRLLKRKAGRGFYYSLAALTENFISHELACLNIKPWELGKPELALVAAEEECFSCGR